MKYVYEPNHQGLGYYHCKSCNAIETHTGVQEFLHREDCNLKSEGEAATEYHFGDLEVFCIQKWGRSSVGRLTKEVLESEFPHLLEIAILD